MSQRCATLPYLRRISEEREWKGVSPSMAGNGARMLYLKRTTDYAVAPYDRTFAVLGTDTHAELSKERLVEGVLAEESFELGTADCLEEDEFNEGTYVLTDYKTWGSYKVAQSIGIKMEDVPTGEVYKTGEKKGQMKTRKEPVYDPSIIDLKAERLQLSKYASEFEKSGFRVSKLRLQVIVRDGNTYVATQRGIDKPMYIIELERIPSDIVEEFYRKLDEVVTTAIRTSTIPPKCSEWESWDGRRCEKYCEVREQCLNREGGN